MITELRLTYSVPVLCKALEVSSSGYYESLNAKDSPGKLDDDRLKIEIKTSFEKSKCTYGVIRIQKDLAKNGIKVSQHKVRKHKKAMNLNCKQVKRYKATTNSKHNLPVAGNLLKQDFKVQKPNQVWVSDITYIGTDEGWLYLAGHKDLFGGRIVGYAMSERMTTELVARSLFTAVAARRPQAGLIHHSDRGTQYCSYAFQAMLEQFRIDPSMSGKGNCFDNAPMESFWGTLKTEMIFHKRYKTRQEAIAEITEYIEIFYNRQRIQERLGFMSPVEYEKQFYKAGLTDLVEESFGVRN